MTWNLHDMTKKIYMTWHDKKNLHENKQIEINNNNKTAGEQQPLGQCW